MATSYALTGVETRFKDDGTKTFITLHMADAPDACFYVSYEGASTLAAQINLVCRKMAQLLTESGNIEKYRGKVAEIQPFQVLSARSGLTGDRATFALSLQTQEGPLLEFAIPADMAKELLASAEGAKSSGPSHITQ